MFISYKKVSKTIFLFTRTVNIKLKKRKYFKIASLTKKFIWAPFILFKKYPN